MIPAIAIHEAGHAVASYVLGGLPFSEVSIVPDRDSLGRVKNDRAPEWVFEACNQEATDIFFVVEAVVLFAGDAAVVLFGADPGDGGRGDREMAVKMLTSGGASSETCEAALDRAEALAREVVTKNREAILDLANALAIRQTMSGDEVRARFRSTISEGQPPLAWASVVEEHPTNCLCASPWPIAATGS